MSRFAPLGISLAAVLTGGLLLNGCDQAAQKAKEAATTAGSNAAQAALGPAVTPILDLLKQAQSKIAAGDLNGAVTAMGGFEAIWGKAAPVIKPLAGDKWSSIETAAQSLSRTFGQGTPSATDASASINALMGPLSALVGK